MYVTREFRGILFLFQRNNQITLKYFPKIFIPWRQIKDLGYLSNLLIALCLHTFFLIQHHFYCMPSLVFPLTTFAVIDDNYISSIIRLEMAQNCPSPPHNQALRWLPCALGLGLWAAPGSLTWQGLSCIRCILSLSMYLIMEEGYIKENPGTISALFLYMSSSFSVCIC